MEVSVLSQPAREAGSGEKARAPALIVSVFTVTFLPVMESQAGRSEPAGAGWPNQVLCCLEHSEESHPLRLVGGQGPVRVLLLSPFLLGSIRPSILLATDATAFSSILRQENRFLELHATRTRLSVWSQGLEKAKGFLPYPSASICSSPCLASVILCLHGHLQAVHASAFLSRGPRALFV